MNNTAAHHTPDMANLTAGSLAVNVLPSGGRVPCRLVRPWTSADGERLGWIVRTPEAKRSGWAVEFANLEAQCPHFADGHAHDHVTELIPCAVCKAAGCAPAKETK